MNGEAPLVFESRPSFFLKGSRPSPLPPIPFFKSPPRKIRMERSGKARGRNARYSARGGIQSIGTQSERTWRVQATTHAERAKWVRAECRIRSHSETSAGVRANEPRACGARRSGWAKCMRRVRANSEGGQGCKK